MQHRQQPALLANQRCFMQLHVCPGKLRLRYDSGHTENVFQAQFLPQHADRLIVTCAADGQVRMLLQQVHSSRMLP